MSEKFPGGFITPTPPYASGNFSGVWTLDQLAQNYYYYKQAVSNSLRFRSSASAYLNRTSSAGNQTTWTWSGWVKRGSISSGSAQYLIQAGGSFGAGINFVSADTLQFEFGNGSSQPYIRTSAVFRDPSAWYHIVAVADTTNATAANRLTLYVNGVLQVLGVTDYPAQNYAGYVNQSGIVAVHGRWNGGSPNQYFDGYMAEINFIDGQALDPSYFGQVSPITGVWSPAKYVGSYGTNGFYLKFSDTTSTTTLCYDYSGNGNNWTPNNISLTAGSTYDSMLDSPTNYDNGGNGVGNYAVLNPLKNYGGTISEANQTVVFPASGNVYQTQNTIAMSSGAWYWEVYITSAVSGVLIGILNTSSSGTESFTSANFWGYYTGNGYKYHLSGSSYGASATAGDVIGVAFDGTNGTLTFYKNNVSQGVAFTGLTGLTVNASVNHDGSGGYGSTTSHNFGQRPFAYTPPSGYKALNTQNLPAASIVNGASFMAATLYTGDSATSRSISNAVNGVSFQPGFVWVKQRNIAQSHALEDIARGPGYLLESNSTLAESTSTTYGQISSFDSGGFTASKGSDPTYSYFNINAGTYIAWQWKAGGTAVTNTAGSITSQVSANTTAGFSVVTYTGTGAAATVGHGLGVAPSMIIVKSRSSGTLYWPVYHVTQGNNKGCFLNLTNAVNNQPNLWNSTTPTSTVLSIGTDTETNTNTATYVAYCFAAIPGYSAFGSYTGNGSSDGPFVFTGMRPRWIMIKRTDSTADWVVFDTSRDSYNMEVNYLVPNTSGAEASGASVQLDGLSNGFKARGTWQGMNASGGTYVYACFAENPFKYSLAR